MREHIFCQRSGGLIGIAIAVSVSALFSYVTMLLTIKRRVFQHGWQKTYHHSV
jgi:hypothetical protein